jgi:hypothetical protein
MALVIEDGTGKADAQTYVDAAAARAYALARGVVLSATDGDVEAQLVQAADYLESKRAEYQGVKTFPGVQALQFPRTGVVLDCVEDVPVDAIPSVLIAAQCQLCIELATGGDVMPSSDGRVVKRTKVDVIEKEFFSGTENGLSGVPSPTFPKVDALLAPLFNACGSGFALRTVRV